MKRRGMYCSGSFFKPYIAPSMPCSLDRTDNDSSRVRPHDKKQFESALSNRNNGLKEVNSVFLKNSDYA